jgi:hypothetical protein
MIYVNFVIIVIMVMVKGKVHPKIGHEGPEGE